jgi:hypothetical protein
MDMHKVFIAFLIFTPLFSAAQDLSGTWEGNSSGSYTKMVVIQKGDSLFGYTYDRDRGGSCKVTFAGKFNQVSQNLKGRGMHMLEKSGSHTMCVFNLKYRIEGSEEFLRGSVNYKNVLLNVLSFMPNFILELKKVSNSIDTISYMRTRLAAYVRPVPAENNKDEKLFEKKPALDSMVSSETKKVNPIIPNTIEGEKKKRNSKLIETIYTNADTITMAVYDNGEVDGDTVSVFFNNTIILDRYRISEKAKVLYLPVSRNSQNAIELFANNLGTIPPNTALIIITAGVKRYELRASYDLDTNAKILIEYKK